MLPAAQGSDARPICYLGVGDAAVVLRDAPSGSSSLVVSSPPYVGLIDYHAAAAGASQGEDRRIWHAGGPSVTAYLDAMAGVMSQLHRVLTDDAILALEVGDIRVPRSGGTMIPLPDWWLSLCEGFGFRLLERICLVRPLALGQRSGHFKKTNRPGYALPDIVSSTLLVVGRGDPNARLRARSTADDAIDVAWAERFLRSMWMTARPGRSTAARIAGHPVPSDAETVRALVRFYSCRGDVVLDPFAGSGTVGHICAEERRGSLLVEREALFAAAIRDRLLGVATPVAEISAMPTARPRVLVPSAQLALALPAPLEQMLRRAFQRSAPEREVTDRHRAMARLFAVEYGVVVPPELTALMMRAERTHVAAVARARGAHAHQL